MHITYTNTTGESLTLRSGRPYFLQRIDGAGNIRQAVNTFHAPDQDGAFYISSTLDMRNITLEGTILANSPDHASALRKRPLKLFTPKAKGMELYIYSPERQLLGIVEQHPYHHCQRYH